jgi:ATP-dependent DNA ligase
VDPQRADWSDRFPLITEAALRNRNSSFVLDGEAVLLGIDGRSDFLTRADTTPRSSSTPSTSW